MAFSKSGIQLSQVAYATETEAEILRGRVKDLETAMSKASDTIEELKQQNEELRRQIAAIRDGAWLHDR